MKRRDPVVKGKDAEQLLEHPLLQEGFDAIEKDAVNALASTALHDGEEGKALEIDPGKSSVEEEAMGVRLPRQIRGSCSRATG